MAENSLGEVRSIPVQEIIEIQKDNFFKGIAIISARKELECYLKEIGSRDALRIGAFVKVIRALEQPPITINLRDFIKNKNYWKLRKVVSSLLIASHGIGPYSSFELHKGWKRKRKGLFWYYYYSGKNFLNVHSIADEDLPLYVAHEFDTEESRNLYLKKLNMCHIEQEKR